MCLAIPGRVIEIDGSCALRAGRVRFGGIARTVRFDFVPEARVGDYVMVHVGFAISRVDEREAERTYELLRQMGAIEEELGSGDDSISGGQPR